MSKTMMDVLEKLYRIAANTESSNINNRYQFNGVDQALLEIEKDYISKEKVLQIIDGAKPKSDNQYYKLNDNFTFSEVKSDCDQYQSNLKEAIK